MLKLILCLFCAVAIAVLLLQLRQQRLELNHQANQLHNQIDSQQARLWSQQLDIALYTAPNAISKTVENKNINLVPQSPQHVGPTSWIQSQ